MDYLVLDIETVPDESLDEELKPEAKLGVLKDPKKIEKKEKEWAENGQIKAMSLDPFMNKIVYVGMWSSISQNYIDIVSLTEQNMIDVFWRESNKHELIVGKNHIGFDLPVLIARSMFLGIELTRNFNLRKYYNYPLYDVQSVLSGYDLSKAKKLDWIGKRLGFPVDNSEGSEIYNFYKEGQTSAIINHCKKDVQVTKQIFDKIVKYYPVNEPIRKYIAD